MNRAQELRMKKRMSVAFWADGWWDDDARDGRAVFLLRFLFLAKQIPKVVSIRAMYYLLSLLPIFPILFYFSLCNRPFGVARTILLARRLTRRKRIASNRMAWSRRIKDRLKTGDEKRGEDIERGTQRRRGDMWRDEGKGKKGRKGYDAVEETKARG
jgi:hypothetical protein